MEITTLPLDLPFVRYKVNVYLIRHRDGLLLVDTGPQAPRTYLDLKEQITALGCTLADLTHIIITHGHFDHFGLAARLKQASGALVCYHALERSRIAEDLLHRPDFFVANERRLRRMGFSADFIQAGQQTHQSLNGGHWALRQQIVADVHLAEGDQVSVGDDVLEIVYCPGHTPGSICLWNRSGGVLFTGDHVGAHVLGEMLLEPHISAPPGEETDALQYLNSLDKVADLPVRAFYPGHGSPGDNFQERVQAIKSWLDELCQQIMTCLDSRPRTALQIHCALEGPARPSLETVSQVCQIVHCLQLLLAQSALSAGDGPDDTVYYYRI